MRPDIHRSCMRPHGSATSDESSTGVPTPCAAMQCAIAPCSLAPGMIAPYVPKSPRCSCACLHCAHLCSACVQSTACACNLRAGAVYLCRGLLPCNLSSRSCILLPSSTSPCLFVATRCVVRERRRPRLHSIIPSRRSLIRRDIRRSRRHASDRTVPQCAHIALRCPLTCMHTAPCTLARCMYSVWCNFFLNKRLWGSI